jgi:hypothetical protein
MTRRLLACLLTPDQYFTFMSVYPNARIAWTCFQPNPRIKPPQSLADLTLNGHPLKRPFGFQSPSPTRRLIRASTFACMRAPSECSETSRNLSNGNPVSFRSGFRRSICAIAAIGRSVKVCQRLRLDAQLVLNSGEMNQYAS